MTSLFIGNNQIFLDEADLPLYLNDKWRWAVVLVNGKKTIRDSRSGQYLHKILLGAEPNQRVLHLNRNRLDNRRENLVLKSWSERLPVEVKKCCGCGITKVAEDFYRKPRTKHARSICKECHLEGRKRYYQKNKERLIPIASIRAKDRKDNSGDWFCTYLYGKSCMDCGYNNILALECDHVRGKTRNVSEMVRNGYLVATMLKELEKCDIVCSNCHKIRTAKRNNNYKVRWLDAKQTAGVR